jgi:hypothetical protein
MKGLNLNAYGVEEMNQQEMMNVEGGSIFSKIGDAIGAAVFIFSIYENKIINIIFYFSTAPFCSSKDFRASFG